MKIKLRIENYVKLGGDVSLLDYNECKATYYDENQFKKIKFIVSDGKNKDNTSSMYKVTFDDDKEQRYSGFWIYCNVDFVLDSKYII